MDEYPTTNTKSVKSNAKQYASKYDDPEDNKGWNDNYEVNNV